MTSYRFLKMAAVTAKYHFWFRICWCHCLQKVKVYQQTKFRRHISIDSWDITTSVFEKQTSGVLEVHFRFRFRPFARNLHIILHQSTEFRPNRSNHCGNMTSYLFLKMAAATVEYYFSLLLMSLPSEGQSLYLKWRLRYNYFRFRNTNSAILEFYFRFRSRPVRRNMHVILYQATEFRPNQSTHCVNMTLYPFLKMAATKAKHYFRFRICWCHCLLKVCGSGESKASR